MREKGEVGRAQGDTAPFISGFSSFGRKRRGSPVRALGELRRAPAEKLVSMPRAG